MQLKLTQPLCYVLAAVAFLVAPLGCGPDANMFEGEELNIENPVSSKDVVDELNLEEGKSDFGVLYPWGPFPFYDYYTEPFAYPVPVGPGVGIFGNYVHPFYAFRAWNPFWNDDDDHHHRRFRDRDDD